jgi:hypothetical protein
MVHPVDGELYTLSLPLFFPILGYLESYEHCLSYRIRYLLNTMIEPEISRSLFIILLNVK